MEKVGFEPRLPAPTAHTAHSSEVSSLSVLQTVAECVLYYYLTKKNENYKSLVRRSYRRRGKSQVRRGQCWDGFPACSAANSQHAWQLAALTAARGDVSSCVSAVGPSFWVLSVAAERPSLGVCVVPQQCRRELGEMAISIFSLENSRRADLVTHRLWDE